MAQWRKVNFDDVPDRSPQSVEGEWRLTRYAIGSEALGVSRFTYDPDSRLSHAHSHSEQEEAFVVVSGSGAAWLDGEEVELGLGDVLHVDPPVPRSFRAGPDGLVLVCVGAGSHETDQVTGHPDPWP